MTMLEAAAALVAGAVSVVLRLARGEEPEWSSLTTAGE